MADEWHSPGVRLKVQYVQGSDGSKQFHAWWDTKLDQPCTFGVYGDASLRCLPQIAPNPDVISAVGNVWASSDCTGSLLVILAKGSIPPKYVATAKGDLVFLLGFGGPYTGAASVGYPGSCSTTVPAGDLRTITPVPGTDFVGGSLRVAL